MVENCYILYSCDGSYEPIVSNYSGLSAHSSSFVSINVANSAAFNDECFYVLDIGVVDCDTTQTVTGVTTGCSCECYCYFIRSANETTDVTYVNCNDEIVVDTIVEGFTYNICSKVYPQFDTTTQIPIKLTDICQDGQCPPTIPTVKPTNECDVITIFPMGVTCSVLQPSSDRSFDGATTLIVTGGTPPYTIFWETGSFAPALTNLGVGEYTATVTDYYNDFSSVTTCVLTAETTTYSGMCFVVSGVVEDSLVYISTDSLGLKNGKPYYKLQYGITTLGYVFWSQDQGIWVFCSSLDCQGSFYESLDNNDYLYPSGSTWSVSGDTIHFIEESYPGPCNIPIVPKINSTLCATLVVRSTKIGLATETTQFDLNPSTDINGQPSWSSSTGQYLVYWNTGSTPSQWVMTGYSNPSVLLINNDPSDPPISNWQVFGPPEVYSLDITEGTCSTAYTISVSAAINDALCGSNGSIIVTPSGGQAPYEYSVDGGLSYQSSPIFNGLTPGNYSVFVKDVNTTVGSLINVSVGTTQNTTYNLTLNVNYTTNTFTITSPVLPNGVTITFDLVQSSMFNYYPATLSPQPTYNNLTTVQGIGVMNLTNTITNSYAYGGPCTVSGPINVTQLSKTYTNTITIGSNQTITGSTTNSIINNPTGSCQNANGYYTLTITNGQINNCNCCQLNLNNTTPPGPAVL